MCALVLALRKIPINAPGGGGAALGSEDKPSYTVAVSDQQAARNRAAFDKAKDAKRLFPNRKPEDAKGTANGAVSTGMDELDPRNSATPPPLRRRQPPTSESTALNTLNTRNPAADTALSPNDMVEPTSPRSVTRSVSGATEPSDLDRSMSINEVRNMLRRGSTRGKRRPSIGSTPRIGIIGDSVDKLPRSNNGSRFEYDPHLYKSHEHSSSPVRKDPMPKMIRESPQSSSRDPSWPQPPTTTYQPKSTMNDHQNAPLTPQTLQQQQRQMPPVGPSDLNFSPPPPPKEESHPSLKNRDPNQSSPIIQPPVRPRDPAQIRGPSPVRNPFQIHALRSQAQGGDLPRAVSRPDSQVHMLGSRSDNGTGPQMRRPVPDNGNTFAKEQSQDRANTGAVRPARSDSLGGSRLER